MQFQVPQNIAMEDRIVGPLTIIQFAIIVVGGGIAFALFNLKSAPALVSRGGAGIAALLTVLMALGKFNDQPLYRFFRFIIAFFITPKTRIWHKNQGDVSLIRPSEHLTEEAKKLPPKRYSKADISRLATVVDSRGQAGVPIPAPPKKP